MQISVIITSYNYSRFLRECIDSVLNQTYKEFELIIVDDCSTDNSWEIICEYKERYPEIITIRHDYNWRANIVADTVRKYATGEYIALQNSDDVWELDKLEKQVLAMEDNPGCVAVFTNARAIDDCGNDYKEASGFYYNLFNVKNRSRHEWLRHFFYEGNCLCHPSVLIKKSVYESDDFFNKSLRQVPDFLKWIQVCKKHEIYVLPDALVKFRIHASGENVSGRTSEKQIRSSIELNLILDEYLDLEQEDFLLVFPEAKKFCEYSYIPEYAFGRICTQDAMMPYTKIYGIYLLYHVLKDKDKAKLIKKEYGFSPVDLANLTGKNDIFGIVPEQYDQTRTIYFDNGNGFNPEDRIEQKYTLGEMESFEWEITFFSMSNVSGIRFDPAENIMTKIQLEKACINGEEVNIAAENSISKLEAYDCFVDLDPRYNFTLSGEKEYSGNIKVYVKGTIKRLNIHEASKTVMDIYYKYKNRVEELEVISSQAKRDYEEVCRLWKKDVSEQNCLNHLLKEKK